MANVDLGRYRRIVQMFWDPEPSNDTVQDQPVWCLGQQYRLHARKGNPSEMQNTSTQAPERRRVPCTAGEQADAEHGKPVAAPPNNAPDTPPESAASSFSSTDYSELSYENGWPQTFLSDFESKFWMTYRSEFQTIPRSSDPKATSALSLHMRLKSQLGDDGGFSSDSGWGCMIRSGQSLLANTMSMILLGRGMNHMEWNIVLRQAYRQHRVAARPEERHRKRGPKNVCRRSKGAVFDS